MKKEIKLALMALALTCLNTGLFSQSSITGLIPGHLPPGVATPVNYWCGWANNVLPFNIEHRGILDINFKNGAFPGTNRMVIKGTGAANPGFVGIGNNFLTPAFRLDVNENINLDMLAPLGRGYRIDGNLAVYTPGGVAAGNTYLGVTNNPGTTGNENVLVGFNAGATAIGSSVKSVIVGVNAGLVNASDGGVYLGYNAGMANGIGDFNTFVGHSSGMGNTTGANNAALGFQSGTGVTIGNQNLFLGANANTPLAAINNAAAIGANAIVRNSDQMILGNTTVSVGIGLSNDPLGPQNTLEVKENVIGAPNIANPLIPGTFGASGIRTRNLTSAATPALANANGGVLTVDANGDFIYVQGAGGSADNGLSTNGPTAGSIHLGQNVGAFGDPGSLLNNRQVPMNNFNLFFTDGTIASNFQNRIQLGNNLTTNYNTFSKLSVFSNATSFTSFPYQTGILGSSDANVPFTPLLFNPYYFTNIGNSVKIGVLGIGNNQVTSTSMAQHVVGVEGIGYNNSTSGRSAYGVIGRSYSQQSNVLSVGVWGIAQSPSFALGVIGRTSLPGQTNIGVQGFATNGTINNIGVWASGNGQAITPTYPNINIGLYAVANPPVPQPSGGSAQYAGFFDGDVWINGLQGIPGFAITSDQQFKNNIDTIINPIAIIKQLKPKTYFLDTANAYNFNFSNKKQYGFIAQDVQLILPELIGNSIKPAMIDSLGAVVTPSVAFTTLNYNAFFALITAAMQKQQRQIEKQDSTIQAMQSQLTALTSSVSSCCSSSAIRPTTPQEQNQLAVTLGDKDAVVLNQNTPNPFAEQTTITYIVPEKFGYAQIIFRTIEGKIIKTVDIIKKGGGQLNVFANDLSSGMYTYSLVVDGKVMDTKKMVKSE